MGEKTAQKLIAQFGSIESLLEHTDQLKGAIKTKVETNRKQILFSKFLATIKTDVPISLDMDGLKREEPDKEELKRIFEDLEFRSLLDRVLGTDKKTAAPPPSAQGDLFGFFAPESTEAPENSNLTRLQDLLQNILTRKILSLDTETTGTDPIRAELVGMSFSYAENQAFYVPVPADRTEAQRIVDKFKPVFENKETLKVR